MKAQCVQAVTQALGRPLLKGEAEAIEQRIRDQMRQLARTDANWQSYSGADRLKMAGEAAGRQLQAEAALKRQRVALQIAAADARLADMRDYAAARPGRTLFDGLAEVLRQIDVAVTGIQRETMTRLMDLLEAAQPGFMRLTGDPQFAKDVVFEAFGRSTGNKAAAAGARVWLQESEGLRARFNRAGGDVGKLDYAYFPQPHDGVRMIKAGRQAWVDAILPKLDRSRYVDETGARLDDGTMRAILDEAFETITTDGRNKLQPGEIPPGVSGVMANRGSQSRAIHFAGPDEYLSYMTDFGRGSVFEGMMSHVRNMSLNIAMVERMGPNAKANFELLHDTARQTGAADQMRWQQWKVSTRDLWNTLSGKQGQVYNGGEVFVNRAQFWQNMRNWQVFAKLQGTLFSAITDVPTYYVTSGYNRAGFLETTHALLKAFIPGAGSTDMANRMGIVSESLTQDMSRWGTELLRDGWTGRLANQTMRVSLLNMWTDALRRASGLAVMGALGRMNKTAWGALEESDRLRLSEQGINAQTWQVMQLAKPEDWGGSMMITPEAIRAIPDADLAKFGDPVRVRDDAVTRLVGMLVDESEYSSLAPDLFTRSRVEAFGQRGTVNGELARTFFLFKSFPMGLISRHWTRAADQWKHGEGANRVAYAAGVFGGMTLFGGVSVMLKDILAGRDPRDPVDPKFWLAASSQGGGLSFLGDAMLGMAGSGSQVGGQNSASAVGSAILGPVFGAAIEGLDVTIGNASQALRGKDSKFGAEALRYVRANLPFVNLWYVRTVLDRAVMHDLQEQLSPGYLSKMRQRARQNYGTDFWWQPGELAPDRAPELTIGGG